MNKRPVDKDAKSVRQPTNMWEEPQKQSDEMQHFSQNDAIAALNYGVQNDDGTFRNQFDNSNLLINGGDNGQSWWGAEENQFSSNPASS